MQMGASMSRRSASSRRFNHHRPRVHAGGYRHRRSMYGGYGYGMGGGYGMAGPIFGVIFVFIILFTLNPIIGIIGLIIAIYLYNKNKDNRIRRKSRTTPQQTYTPAPRQAAQPQQTMQQPSNQTMTQSSSGYYQRPKAIYCKVCKAGVLSDSQFCAECGTKV